MDRLCDEAFFKETWQNQWKQMGPYGQGVRPLMYSNPHNQKVAQAWYRSRPVHYLDLGEVDVQTTDQALNTIYFFITGFDHLGTPVLVQGQYPVLKSVPGSPGYSQFSRVIFVEVPAAYIPNLITSEEGIDGSEYPLLQTDLTLSVVVL